LASRANRVRLLIGDAHWLSDGHHKEYLIREFLDRHLPATLSSNRGFVRPPDESMCCSPEVDVLISDSMRHVPFFNEGGLSIVAPSACVGHFEVKTTFEKDTLKDAIEHQIATQQIIDSYTGAAAKVWRGIAFFSMPESRSLESAANTLVDALLECADSLTGDITLAHFPKCVSVFDDCVFFLGESQTAGRCQIRAFDLGTASAAAMFSDLFSHLRINVFGARPSQAELDTVLQSLDSQAFWSKDVPLKE
jgi:hypothetical protein